MDEKKALEEISYIKEIMQDSRKTLVDNGVGYIMWGVIIVLGLLSSYYMTVNNVQNNYGLNWIILIAIGWIYSFVEGVKQGKKHKPATLAGKILTAVWFSSGIAMTIIGFIGTTSGGVSGVYVSPVISVILGVAFFISGVVYGNKWITMLSLGWWAGAMLMFYWPGMQVFWIMSLMMILFQIVPGVILYQQAKKELA
ncbi:hypothetical protein BMS3Abin04_02475 [bacterium BMS3Abin04]|nr:hypothetical protein BMS3Abin04_02475 [bacterium BMS3Abin04]